MDRKRRIFFTLHPKFDLMFTVGNDNFLRIWDIENHN